MVIPSGNPSTPFISKSKAVRLLAENESDVYFSINM
jgi:hypothetical protein